MDIGEAVELTQLAFHLADRWRTPVLVQGDYLLAHTAEAVDVAPADFGPTPNKDWAVDGSGGGSGSSKVISPLGIGKTNTPGPGIEGQQQAVAEKLTRIEAAEPRAETGFLDDADHVVVAFGTPAKFVRYAVRRLRDKGLRVGYVRPITLWPFPSAEVAAAAAGKRSVLVFELNAGQMIDDVRLAVLASAPVRFIGGISTDHSGFGVGALLDVEVIAGRIELAIEEVAAA
jgi:2-oxoglutarate ferredoxin oxidoreductase subunit alpha